MQNEHREYIRISDNNKTVCLMIHGIVGTPRYFDDIIPLLPTDWSVYNILLDGHGGSVKDFSGTSMKKWKCQVGETVKKLEKEYENIVVIAHSMGTLLSIREALKNKGHIKRMILFAVPLNPRVKPIALITALKVIFKITSKDEPIELAAKRQYSVEPDWRLWRYIGFIPRYLELLGLVKSIRKVIDEVKVPSTVFMCGKDEMVSIKSRDQLKENPCFTNYFLESSSHNYFDEDDFEIVKTEIRRVINEVEHNES